MEGSAMAGDAYQEKLKLYERLVATNPAVQRKGATMPYTSLNGHMFSILTKEGKVGLRLPEIERQAFLEEFNTTLQEHYGIVQKEYVVVPNELLEKTEQLKKYFDISYAYVGSMKPKPTSK